jgi:hypothetical protein
MLGSHKTSFLGVFIRRRLLLPLLRFAHTQSIFCSNAQFGVTNPGIFFLTNRLGGAADHQPVCRDRPLNQFPIKNSTVLRHGIE